MNTKNRYIGTEVDWDEMTTFWANQYEEDYEQFFCTEMSFISKISAKNISFEIFREELCQIHKFIKDIESYIKKPLPKNEEMIQLFNFINAKNLFSIYAFIIAHRAILETFEQIKLIEG